MAATPISPGEALWIGYAGGKNHYNVGIGQGTSGGQNHEDFDQSVIEDGYEDPDKFFLNGDNNPVFRINAGAGRTSANTAHPRSECRELLAGGEAKAAWDGRSNEHRLSGRCRITDVTSNRPWVCFAQIHGSDISPNTSDLIRLQSEGADGTSTNLSIVSRRTPPGGSEIRTVLMTGYDVNDWMTYDLGMYDGRLKVTLNSTVVLDAPDMGQVGNYFKFGCYLQDNPEKGASPTDWAAVEYQRGSVVTWHTGTPNPTQPIFTGPDDGLGAGTDTIPPSVPTDLAAIRGDTQAILVWDASTDNVGVTGYKVYSSQGGAAITVGKSADGASSSASSTDKIAVSLVSPSATGTVTSGHARAWLSATGSSATKVVIYADSASAPGALLAVSDEETITLTAEAVTDYTFSGGNQIVLTQGTNYWIGLAWDDPGTPSLNLSRDAGASGRVEMSGFAYPTLPNPGSTPTPFAGPIDVWVETGGSGVLATPTTTTYTATGLTNGVEYGFSVSAVDAAGNESAPTDQVLVTPGPPDLTAPSVPANLAATGGDRKVSLTWDASTDADTGVREYNVYRDGEFVDSTTETSFVDGDLDNGTLYSFTVSAVDNSLNESAASTPDTATPTAPPIGGVPFLVRDLGAGASIALEAAFGADLAADPESWVWTDITEHVRDTSTISTSLGRSDESGTSNPAELTVLLDNDSGDYSRGGRSRHHPYIRRNTPIRLRIDPDDGGGGRIVLHAGATSWTPGWESGNGRVPVVTLSASGTLRRLKQGDAPVTSAFRRAMVAASSVVAYWPMEEGRAAEYAPAVRGGNDLLVIGTPDWDTDDSFNCSAKLPKMKDSAMEADVFPYPDTGETQVRFLLLLPEDVASVPSGAWLISIFTTGSIGRWDITYGFAGGAGNSIGVHRYLPDGTFHSSNNLGFQINGKPGRMSLEMTQNGSDIDWRIAHIEADPDVSAGFVQNTVANHTVGIVTRIRLAQGQDLKDTVIGHVTVENEVGSQFSVKQPLIAFEGERASSSSIGRIERLCAENGVALTRHTSSPAAVGDNLTDFDAMGPQLVAPLLDLLHEAEAADQGQLWDGRAHGLSYTTRRRREEGIVKLTIDASDGELAPGFEPTDDDQRTRNRFVITRTHGITASYEDTSGPLGTDVIGIYDDSDEVNIGRDQDVIEHAQWRVGLGTVEGDRYPSLTVDLRAAPHLAADVLDIIPGERIDVIDLDDTLDEFTLPTVSLIVEGIAHEISQSSWLVTFACSPFEPWAVGRVAAEVGDTSDMVMRLDTDGSQLAAAAAAGATSISVATDSGAALWTTVSDDFPFWVQVGGLPVRVTACSGSTSPQTMTVDPLPLARSSGAAVALHEPRRLGMGKTP